MNEGLSMQDQQDAVQLLFTIDGNPDWQSCLTDTVKLDEVWAKMCGGDNVPAITYLRKQAEVNDTSLERCAINYLLNHGFVLEELEFHSEDGGEDFRVWGKCIWYKDHPSYKEPLDGVFEKMDQKWAGFLKAVLKTEHVGDQKSSLFSAQMIAASLMGKPCVLLNKTFVFHRVAFISPNLGATDRGP